MKQVIPGYDEKFAPSIALPRDEHKKILNIKGTYNGSARDLLAKDIKNLRKYTEASKQNIQELINLNKVMYPQSFSK